jgi:hypothetical protein
MTTMTHLPTEAADPMLAAELLRRRWQEKPAYFPPRTVRSMPRPHARRLSLPGRGGPVMHWLDLPGLKT